MNATTRDTVTPAQLRYLACIMSLAQDGPVKLRDVAARLDVALRAVQDEVKILRRKGLVAWDERKAGTLRPIVEFVPAERR